MDSLPADAKASAFAGGEPSTFVDPDRVELSLFLYKRNVLPLNDGSNEAIITFQNVSSSAYIKLEVTFFA